jgi:hypothetical protein
MRAALVAAALLFAVTAQAGVASDPMLSEAFGKLLGKWKCKGKMAMVPGEEMRASAATLKVSKELDGFVYVADYVRKKTKKLQGVKLKWTWGFDPQRKMIIHTGYDTFSGLEEGKAEPIQGDTLTVNIDYSTGATMVKQRLVMTQTKGKELKLVREIETDDGWVRLGEEVCKK